MRNAASLAKADKLGLSPDSPIPVSRLARPLRRVLGEAFPEMVWLTGEVADLRRDQSGTVRFSLQHDNCRMAGVIWPKPGVNPAAKLKNGVRAIVLARLGVCRGDARVQLAVTNVRLDGAGEKKRQLEQVRRRLLRDGLLDPRRKRAIPSYPRAVAVITSRNGAALQDIIAVARRRHPGIGLLVVPAIVQGPNAARSIVRALGTAQRSSTCDVVIIARGGGTAADLDAFNDETVARAIAACRLPVVTAIGHETDRSLADDVADLRVGTPSMAAERTIPERRHLVVALTQLRRRAQQALEGRVREARTRLHAARAAVARITSAKFYHHRNRLVRSREALSRQAGARLQRTRSRLGHRQTELPRLMSYRMGRERARVDRLAAALAALDPTAVLSRGYAILSDERGRVVSSVAEARLAGALTIRLRDGDLVVQVSAPV